MSTPTTDPELTPAETDAAGPDQPRSLAARLTGGTDPGGPLERLDALGGSLLARPGRTLGWLAAALVVLALVVSEVSLGRVLISGVAEGAIYSLVALGIALVYSSTRVLNFAQGEFGTVPAFVVLVVLLGGDLLETVDPAGVSVVRLTALTLMAILLGAALAVGTNLLVIQRLKDASPVTSLVATAGMALLFTGAQFVLFEPQARRFPRFLDGAPCLSGGADGECARFLSLFGFRISWQILIMLGVLVVVGALLAALLRTPVGVALVASAQEPYAASLHGISPKAMSSLAWGLAGGLGALAGVLAAGNAERIIPGQMTATYLIPGFTAAVLGGLTSMKGAVVGGVILGIAATLAVTLIDAYQLAIAGGSDLAAFVMLLLVLLVRPNGLFGRS